MLTYFSDTSTHIGTLAFDVNTDETRAGFAGDDMPRTTFPSVVCTGVRSRESDGEDWAVLEDGDSHLSSQTLGRIAAHPLRQAHGDALDDAVLRGLLLHGLRRLGESTWHEHPLLLSESTGSSAAARRGAAELVFEDIGAPALCVCHAAELICVSAGRPTATVLELNDDAATASIVVDGALQARSVIAAPQLGGQQLASTFAHYISPLTGPLVPSCEGRGVTCADSFLAYRTSALRRELCDSLCRCTESAPKAVARGRGRGRVVVDLSLPSERPEYTLPDGRKIEVPDQHGAQACENLFASPVALAAVGGAPLQPLQSMVLSAIASLEPDTHKELLRSVIVTGSVACLPGVPERLEQELAAAARASPVATIAQQAHRLTIFIGSTHERKNGAWLGASILGSLGSHHDLWMSRSEYDEYGPPLINRKGMQYAW